jgi:hypothetical protein
VPRAVDEPGFGDDRIVLAADNGPRTGPAAGYIATDMVATVPKEALDKVIAKIPVGRLGEDGGQYM